MTTSKIEVELGQFKFSGEGESDWLATQLDKILDRMNALAAVATPPAAASNASTSHAPADLSKNPEIASKPLAGFLKEKNATTKQVTKFLATAIWLEAKGQKRLSTADITGALRNASQNKLNNAADCLNQNVAKGLCEKEGQQFFVTQAGKDSFSL